MDLSIFKELPALIKEYAGALTTISAAIGVIVAFRIKTRAKRIAKQKNSLGIVALESKVEHITQEISKHHEESSNAMNEMYAKMKQLDDAQDEKISKQFQQLTELMKDSEMERLRDKIYEAADKARHGDYISGEYFARTREILRKYEKLGGDGEAHGEWEFFVSYYDGQLKKERTKKERSKAE